MVLADYHLHTRFSGDSKAAVSAMVERAISLGLQRICFTDHLDLDYPETPENRSGENPFLLDCPAYVRRMEEVVYQYRNRIEVRIGIEIGMTESGYDRYRELLQEYPFDFTIASTHVVDRMDPYFPQYWAKFDCPEEGVKRYFASVLEHLGQFTDFDTLGHLDYIIRYVPEAELRSYAYETYKEQLDRILLRVIELDKCLEVNTAGYQHGLKVPNPQPQVLKRYRELGGEKITIGSDGHKPEHMAYGFQMCRELLESLGYRYYAVFDHHELTMWRL